VSVRAVVVAHREGLAAEAIAAALARYPGVAPVGVATSAAGAERAAERADAVAIDARIPGARRAASRLRRRGLRVVLMAEVPVPDVDDGDGVVVALDASVDRLAAALVPGARRPRPTGALSAREDEVLRLAAQGLAGKQIARAMGISPKTVEQHKTRAFRRLGVPNQAAAVAIVATGGDRVWSPSAT
jgi:DNA-binding NarL/FixJ family response regulator